MRYKKESNADPKKTEKEYSKLKGKVRQTHKKKKE